MLGVVASFLRLYRLVFGAFETRDEREHDPVDQSLGAALFAVFGLGCRILHRHEKLGSICEVSGIRAAVPLGIDLCPGIGFTTGACPAARIARPTRQFGTEEPRWCLARRRGQVGADAAPIDPGLYPASRSRVRLEPHRKTQRSRVRPGTNGPANPFSGDIRESEPSGGGTARRVFIGDPDLPEHPGKLQRRSSMTSGTASRVSRRPMSKPSHGVAACGPVNGRSCFGNSSSGGKVDQVILECGVRTEALVPGEGFEPPANGLQNRHPGLTRPNIA